MPDNLETNAVKSYTGIISAVSAIVDRVYRSPSGQENMTASINSELPNWGDTFVVPFLVQKYQEFHQAFQGYSITTQESLEGLFLAFVVEAELRHTPWGLAFRHLAFDKPLIPERDVYLSRLPYFFLPQECVVTGKSLALTSRAYKGTRGSAKGKIKVESAKNQWKEIQTLVKQALHYQVLDCTTISEGQTSERFLPEFVKTQQERFSGFWSLYKILTEKHTVPYTPRYQLFNSYKAKEYHFNHLFTCFFSPFKEPFRPINLSELPAMFTSALEGKIIVEICNQEGLPVDFQGNLLDSTRYISLQQLDDYFIEP